MKTFKAIVLICLAILSQTLIAGEWNHLEMNKEGYHLRVSYTKRFVTPTYGTNGGAMTGKLFVDLYTKRATLADRVEIYEVYGNGSKTRVSVGRLLENNQQHHYVQLDRGGYAGTLAIGKLYLLRLMVDGRIVDFWLKLN